MASTKGRTIVRGRSRSKRVGATRRVLQDEQQASILTCRCSSKKEQLICNQQMECSSPPAGSIHVAFDTPEQTQSMVKNHFATDSGYASRTLPTFLGIGSMRCGSTWLYEVLRRHPDVQLASCKEMDFFFMHKMLEHDFDWYESHFRRSDGAPPKPIRGEISPLYARLKGWQVKRIASFLPDARIVLALRHPIDRVWSQAVYEFGHRSHRDVRKVGALEFLRQVERQRSRLSSDYCRTIRIWSDAFGADALHIALFDQLRADPQTYVENILKHIGASTPWTIPADLLAKKVWATNTLVKHDRKIPELVRWYIADRLLKPTERLNEILQGQVSKWVDELREIRAQGRFSWRLLKRLNRAVLSVPETLAYEAYHAVLDVRLLLRWRQLRNVYSVQRDNDRSELKLQSSY